MRARGSFSAPKQKRQLVSCRFCFVAEESATISTIHPNPPLKRRALLEAENEGRHEATPSCPLLGGWGCKQQFAKMPARSAGSWLVFRSKSKSFEDKIKQSPLKHRFRGFFICCRLVSLRRRGAPTRQSPSHEVSLRISIVKIRDTYSKLRGHFGLWGNFF